MTHTWSHGSCLRPACQPTDVTQEWLWSGVDDHLQWILEQVCMLVWSDMAGDQLDQFTNSNLVALIQCA